MSPSALFVATEPVQNEPARIKRVRQLAGNIRATVLGCRFRIRLDLDRPIDAVQGFVQVDLAERLGVRDLVQY